MMEKLFVYGTLKNKRIQRAVLGRSDDGEPDELLGFCTSTFKMGNLLCPVIVSDSSSSVFGLVISVNSEEMKLLDKYETKAYKRVRVTLKSGITTWVYVENNRINEV